MHKKLHFFKEGNEKKKNLSFLALYSVFIDSECKRSEE